MKLKGLMLILFILLAGCSQNPKDGISEDQLAVIRLDDKVKISFGMTRDEVNEKLGVENPGDDVFTGYDSGLSVIFREDKVVSITLSEGSEGVYETADGVGVGMTKQETMDVYGDKSRAAQQDPENSLSYIYDTETEEYWSSHQEVEMEAQNISGLYLINSRFNPDGSLQMISLGDYFGVANMI
jgi:outer membrane protein assembly factor BamE (lipoprotein component of BamABCDE complex)